MLLVTRSHRLIVPIAAVCSCRRQDKFLRHCQRLVYYNNDVKSVTEMFAEADAEMHNCSNTSWRTIITYYNH